MLLWWGYIHFDSHLRGCWLSAVLWCELGGFFGLKHWCSLHGELTFWNSIFFQILLFQHKATFCLLPVSRQISKPFLRPFLSFALSRAGFGWQNWRAWFGNRRQTRWIMSWNVNMFSWSCNCASSDFSCCLRSGALPSFNRKWKISASRIIEIWPAGAVITWGCGMCTRTHTQRYAELYSDSKASDFAVLLCPK